MNSCGEVVYKQVQKAVTICPQDVHCREQTSASYVFTHSFSDPLAVSPLVTPAASTQAYAHAFSGVNRLISHFSTTLITIIIMYI